MVVLTTGHQDRCILWELVAIINKWIGFSCGLKFFTLSIFCEEYLQLSLCLMLQICLKNILSKMCQWLESWASKHVSFILFGKGLYPISSGKLWVLNSSPNIQFQAIIRSSYYIFYHFSTLRWCRYLKSFVMEDKDLFILQPISLQLMIWHSKKPGHKQP